MNKLAKSQKKASQSKSPSIAFLKGDTWTVTMGFSVTLTDGSILRVRKGFKTDLASIPRIFWVFFPPFGEYNEASIVHDYMYKKKYPRRFADIQFLYFMKQSKVGLINRYLFYFIVRLFGWMVY